MHLNDPDITRHRPTSFVTWVTGNADAIEKQLIVELRPLANERVG